PPGSGLAIALIVKSRVARSSPIEPRRGVKSTVRPPLRATRQPPCVTESGKGAPSIACAYARAACSGSRQAMSTSRIGRPSSSSRPAPLAVDEHLRPREGAPEPVGVPERDEPDPGRPSGHERAAVPSALARPELLHLGQLAAPAEDGLEAVVRRVGAERGHAVDRD